MYACIVVGFSLLLFTLYGCNNARLGVRSGAELALGSTATSASTERNVRDAGFIAGLSIESDNNKPLKLRADPEIRTINSTFVLTSANPEAGISNYITTKTTDVILFGSSAMLMYNILASDDVIQPYICAGGALYFPMVTIFSTKEQYEVSTSLPPTNIFLYQRNLEYDWQKPIVFATGAVGARIPISGSFGIRIEGRILHALVGSSYSISSHTITSNLPHTTLGIIGGFYVTL